MPSNGESLTHHNWLLDQHRAQQKHQTHAARLAARRGPMLRGLKKVGGVLLTRREVRSLLVCAMCLLVATILTCHARCSAKSCPSFTVRCC